MKYVDMPIGAEVECADSRCGTTTCLVIDPSTETVTHVVVKQNWFLAPEYLVPIEQVTETSRKAIRLRCTSLELENMEPFVETEFISMSGPTDGGGIFMMWPPVPSTMVAPLRDEHVPDGELAIHQGAHVEATNGRIGRVKEFLIDPQSGHISHLVLEKGHLWGYTSITIPITEVDTVDGDTVYLKIDKRAAVSRIRGRPESQMEGKKDMTPIGQRVKELRIAQGMTQVVLADRAGVTHSLISALESGRRKYVSAYDVERLAKGLGIPADELWKLIPGGRSDLQYISIVETGKEKASRAA